MIYGKTFLFRKLQVEPEGLYYVRIRNRAVENKEGESEPAVEFAVLSKEEEKGLGVEFLKEVAQIQEELQELNEHLASILDRRDEDD